MVAFGGYFELARSLLLVWLARAVDRAVVKAKTQAKFQSESGCDENRRGDNDRGHNRTSSEER